MFFPVFPEKEQKKFALLIDGDNSSQKYIKYIIDRSTLYGTITHRKIFGDWTKPEMNGWKKHLVEYSITPMQQFAYTKGKNATDSAMIIEAMDILYSRSVSGFILVSSDSDFTKLASRLRESGMIVVGIGNKNTPESFVSSCTSFDYFPEDHPTANKETVSNKSSNKKKDSKKTSNTKDTPDKKDDADKKPGVTPIDDVRNMIDLTLEKYREERESVIIVEIYNALRNRYPNFDCRDYGHTRFIYMLREMGYRIVGEGPNKSIQIGDM